MFFSFTRSAVFLPSKGRDYNNSPFERIGSARGPAAEGSRLKT